MICPYCEIKINPFLLKCPDCGTTDMDIREIQEKKLPVVNGLEHGRMRRAIEQLDSGECISLAELRRRQRGPMGVDLLDGAGI